MPHPSEANRDPIAVARVLLLALRANPVLLEAVHEPLVLEALADAIGAGEPIALTDGALGYCVGRELGDLARMIARVQAV